MSAISSDSSDKEAPLSEEMTIEIFTQNKGLMMRFGNYSPSSIPIPYDAPPLHPPPHPLLSHIIPS